jgi:hypothetical protein
MEHVTLKHAQFLRNVAVVNLMVHTGHYNAILKKIFDVKGDDACTKEKENAGADTPGDVDAKEGIENIKTAFGK